jgi:hypothetical protein
MGIPRWKVTPAFKYKRMRTIVCSSYWMTYAFGWTASITCLRKQISQSSVAMILISRF